MSITTSFIGFIQGFKLLSLKEERDNDLADRLSSRFSVIFLTIICIMVSSNQYVGNPIRCMVPKEFSGAWESYVNNYCWIKNTYWLPLTDQPIYPGHKQRVSLEINYYQWIPIVLMIQAILFYLPSLFWKLFNWNIGINIQEIMNKAMTICLNIRTKPEEKKEEKPATDKDEESKEKESEKLAKSDQPVLKEPTVPADVLNIAHHLETTVDAVSEDKSWLKRTIGSVFCCCVGNRQYGMYLVNLYLLTKVLYVINIIGQFFLVKAFIGASYNWLGFSLLSDLIKGNSWHLTGHFPLITLCDFQIRSLAQRRNYTVQCVLPINMFNEKIYIFIWFWFMLVAVITIISLVQWIVRLTAGSRTTFIKDFIRKFEADIDLDSPSTGQKLLKSFIEKRLRCDGAFLIYLVYLNAGDMVTKELLEYLWYRHKLRNPMLLGNPLTDPSLRSQSPPLSGRLLLNDDGDYDKDEIL